jgi:hypothetical protein
MVKKTSKSIVFHVFFVSSEKHGVKENFKHFAIKNSITSPKSQVKNIQSSCTQTLL